MAGFGHKNNSKKNKPQQKNQILGESLLKNAIDFHVQGDLANAEKAYKKAMDCGISNVAIFSNLGFIYQATQRIDQAIAHYKKAIAINHNHPDPYTNLGGLYKDLGELDQALASTLKSLELKPDNHTALMNLGGIYQALGNPDQALASTLKSLELEPNNHTALMNLGGIYQALGNPNQALASTLKSLELKPDNPDAYINLGGIYQDLGNLDQALASTLKSLELRPDNPDALSNLGSIYLSLENLNEALKSTLKALEYSPDNPDALSNLSHIRLHLGDLNEAQEAISQAIKIKPNKARYHLLLGLIFCAKGDFDQALKSQKEALNFNMLSKQDEFLAFILSSSMHPGKEDWQTNKNNGINKPKKTPQFPIITQRAVEPGLTKMLYAINALDLNQIEDPTYGKARGSNYNFFGENRNQFQHLEEDLISIMETALNSEIYIYASFYTILSGSSVVQKHNHINLLDRHEKLNIGKKKFALVYYLETGDQKCSEPGILKFHDPDKEVLPFQGMVTIFPGSMYHSVKYNGEKDRIIIGVNFYSRSLIL